MTHIEEINHYWDSRATGYSQKSVAELSSQEAEYWQNQLQTFLPEGQGLSCLDLGCGPGFLGILLGKMGHCVTFCDYSQRMLDEAQHNAQAAGIDFSLHRCDAQSPDFPDGTFDVVVSRNLVWNLEQPEVAYDQWLRILKKGGKLVVFDGNHYLYRFNKDYRPPMSPDGQDPHRPEVMGGVNPDIMEEIARELPLSPVERPAWDVQFFLSRCQVANLCVAPQWRAQHTNDQRITHFALAVETQK